jgi:FkbM family methyltransferase
MVTTQQVARTVLPRSVRNWVRAPRKTLLWAWHHTQYLFGFTRTMEIRPGWNLVCHPDAYRGSYHAQRDDPDQVAEFDNFIGHCTPGMVFFDVGAHFGLFALAALHYGGPSARALAVDASPAAVRMIQAQARLNRVGERLQVVRACVCDRRGMQDMLDVGVLAEGYFAAPDEDHDARERTATPATTLDLLAEQFGLQPTHVKIDVEGFEGTVLAGGSKVLSAPAAPIIFLELHNQILRERGEDPEAVLALLAQRGYFLFDTAGLAVSIDAVLARPLVRLVARKA